MPHKKRARSEHAKNERKSHLLVAALDEFFERGFSAARMEDIARRAKISKGTLYLYF
ncbi:MAG: AcrR family transcriptional regulator [Lentisphaeria bacterium]|jgi:AcrR family transcriptional regulator